MKHMNTWTTKDPITTEQLLSGNKFNDFSDEELKECWKDYLFLSANGALKEDAFSYPILRHFCTTSVLGTTAYAIELLTAIACRHMAVEKD